MNKKAACSFSYKVSYKVAINSRNNRSLVSPTLSTPSHDNSFVLSITASVALLVNSYCSRPEPFALLATDYFRARISITTTDCSLVLSDPVTSTANCSFFSLAQTIVFFLNHSHSNHRLFPCSSPDTDCPVLFSQPQSRGRLITMHRSMKNEEVE